MSTFKFFSALPELGYRAEKKVYGEIGGIPIYQRVVRPRDPQKFNEMITTMSKDDIVVITERVSQAEALVSLGVDPNRVLNVAPNGRAYYSQGPAPHGVQAGSGKTWTSSATHPKVNRSLGKYEVRQGKSTISMDSILGMVERVMGIGVLNGSPHTYESFLGTSLRGGYDTIINGVVCQTTRTEVGRLNGLPVYFSQYRPARPQVLGAILSVLDVLPNVVLLVGRNDERAIASFNWQGLGARRVAHYNPHRDELYHV